MSDDEITLKTWLEDHDWCPSSQGIELYVSGVKVPRESWGETFVAAGDDVKLVFTCDDDDPWIEREPFERREKSPEIVGMVRHLLIKPEEPEEESEEEEPEEEPDVYLVLMQDLEAVYADHADTPGAEAARDVVRDIIPTLTDPESYDVEIAFRARLRRQP